jgi:hypothetical protein
VIEDSAFEYVDLPPIIFESFDESDSEMSFTDLTESSISDRFYDTQQSLSEINAMEGENRYSGFGEKSLTSMSFNELYESCGPMRDSSESLEDMAAFIPAVYNEADLNSQNNNTDDRKAVDHENYDDDDDDDTCSKPQDAPWYCCLFGMLSSTLGVFGMFLHCLSSQRSADTEDVVAATHISATANKGFFISSLVPDGGAIYITYVLFL